MAPRSAEVCSFGLGHKDFEFQILCRFSQILCEFSTHICMPILQGFYQPNAIGLPGTGNACFF